MPIVVLPLIACGALTQIAPSQARAAIGVALDSRGAFASAALGFVLLYAIVVMAPSTAAPFIYFQF